MPIKIEMPRLSDTMEQGTVVTWHVSEGDTVSAGDVIADIETDKATMELESFDDGTVAKIGVEAGKTVSVGETIVILAEEGEDPKDAAKGGASAEQEGSSEKESSSKKESSSQKQSQSAGGNTSNASRASSSASSCSGSSSSDSGSGATATQDPPAAGSEPDAAPGGEHASSDDEDASSGGDASSNGRIFASPLARKIAEEHKISLDAIEGSGPSGRIIKKDVERALDSGGAPAAAPQRAPAPAPSMSPAMGAELESRNEPLSNMRATIARRLVESKTTIPHYQVTLGVRLDALMSLREELNEQLESQGVKLSVNDFIVRATALAMHEHPYVNASWNDDGPSIDLHGRVSVGVAVALPQERGGGLVVATINDTDTIGLRQISAETKRLAKKAREKGLSPEELSGSTFTVSNLGMFGVDHFTAIINPPNAAILAVGRAVPKPFVEEGEDGEPELVVGHEMSMTMSSDHRIVDGAMAAAYLNTVKQLLESPAALLV